MTETVDHFGIHELPSGIRFLVQGGGVELGHNIDLKLDVKLEGRNRGCPHRINLHDVVDPEGMLPEHPLVDLFKPLPNTVREVVTLADNTSNLQLLHELRRLSAPTFHAKRILLSSGNPPTYEFLTQTNIQPVVGIGYSIKSYRTLNYLSQLAPILSTPVVLLLPDWMARTYPGFMEVDLKPAQFKALPMEQIGAGLVRQHLQEVGGV